MTEPTDVRELRERLDCCSISGCDWTGPASRAKRLGGIGPLCPECGETTEPAALPVTEPTLSELREKIERADQMVTNICKPRYTPGAREWTMSIPARPDHDPDLVIGAGLDAGRAALERLEKLEAALRSGAASDGYHTHRELYDYRMLYNAHAARGWLAAGIPVVKSWKHSDGEPCFGGGWFIVTAELPTGQVSNHYAAEQWHLFDVPEVDLPAEYDGHTPADAAKRLLAALATPAPAPQAPRTPSVEEVEGEELAIAIRVLEDHDMQEEADKLRRRATPQQGGEDD